MRDSRQEHAITAVPNQNDSHASKPATAGRAAHSSTGQNGAHIAADLDELDQGIMKLLLNDARLPSSQIARELGVPEATVRYRVRRLKSRGRILSVSMPTYRDVLRASFFVR